MAKGKHGTGKWKYGSVSALMLAMVLIALIALNAGIYALEKNKGWRVDLSFNGITSQSAETTKTLGELRDPVTIYALFQKGNEDAQLVELLNRYAAASDLVSWQQVDPALNPTLMKRFTANGVTPATDNLIVHCEKTDRFRVLGAQDFVSVGVDMDSGEFTYTGWIYERSITSAIAYVTKERVPRVVILKGHGQLNSPDLEQSLESFRELLEANQYEVVFQDLKDSAYTPDPQDLLVFFSPRMDLTETEFAALTEFAGKGGNFLFTCDYEDPVSSMPRYAALLRSYGFLPLEGAILADREDKDSYYEQYTTMLVPEMCATDMTVELLAAGAKYLILPGTRGFEEPEEADRYLTVSAVLRSAPTSYRKELTGLTTSFDRTENDEVKDFPLALEARRITTEGYVSRAFIIGSSPVLMDSALYAQTYSQQLTISIMEFLLETEGTNTQIAAKEILRPALKTASTTLGSVLLVALPLSVLLAALLVLGPRRSR